MQYQYVAYTLEDGIIKGRIEAEDAHEARASLLDRGLKPLRLRRALRPPNLGKLLPGLYAVKEAELIAFARSTSTMLSSGANLIRALEMLEAEAKSRGMKRVLVAVKEKVSGGDGLSTALRAHPDVFDEVFVSLVEVGEYTGRLASALEQLGDIMSQEQEAKARVKKALMMPVFLMGTSFLMLGFMSLVSLPPLLDTFNEMGIEIPLLTRLMVGGSTFFKENILQLAVGLFVFIFIYKLVRKIPSARFAIDVSKARMPLMGPLLMSAELGRFSRVLSTLLGNGVEFPSALSLGMGATKNEAIHRAWEDAEEALVTGQPVVKALERHPVLPRLFIELIKVGEETNTLRRTMDELASAYEKQFETRIEAILAVAEPASTFSVGGVIFFMAMSVMRPILEASNAVSP